MAVTLGKRKRLEKGSEPQDDDDDARAIFQRAFEAKFKPLEKAANPIKLPETNSSDSASDNDPSDEDSDWDGISEDDHLVQVVEHDAANESADDLARQELKAFMSSKPPVVSAQVRPVKANPTQSVADDEGESSNLKHDLALQRLLKESHLLDRSGVNTSSSTPEGKSRIKALDLRLQGLGAKKSLLQQEKMPLAHRKGINAKASAKEATRRKEAVENGIILERAKVASEPQKRRERGIGGPSIGKFRSGTLKLSSHDVKSIERSGQQRGGKSRKR